MDPIVAINKPDRPFAVGLTGGIGCGKTTVTDQFAKLGVTIIDADVIARELVEPGSPLLGEIAAAFGSDILQPGGHLDRRKLRERVFDDSNARAKLEQILHPEVGRQIIQRLSEATTPYAVVAVPLLVESGMDELVDRVLVVDCSRDSQIARVVARDGSSSDQVRAIIDAQASNETRLAVADDVVDNDGSVADLIQQIDRLHQQYLSLAAA